LDLQPTETPSTTESLFGGDFPTETEHGQLNTGSLVRGRCLQRVAGQRRQWEDCNDPTKWEGVLASPVADASTDPEAIIVYVSGSFDEDGGTLSFDPALGTDGEMNVDAVLAGKANNLYLG